MGILVGLHVDGERGLADGEGPDVQVVDLRDALQGLKVVLHVLEHDTSVPARQRGGDRTVRRSGV